MQPANGEAFLTEQTLHHPTAREGVFQMQFINPTHQPEVFCARWARRIAKATLIDPKNFGLAC